MNCQSIVLCSGKQIVLNGKKIIFLTDRKLLDKSSYFVISVKYYNDQVISVKYYNDQTTTL